MYYEVMVMAKGQDRYSAVAVFRKKDEAERLLSMLKDNGWESPPKIERRMDAGTNSMVSGYHRTD